MQMWTMLTGRERTANRPPTRQRLSPKWMLEDSAMKMLRNFWIEDDGVTAIEYGLIAALVAAVLVTAVSLMGTNLSALFTWIAGKLTHP